MVDPVINGVFLGVKKPSDPFTSNGTSKYCSLLRGRIQPTYIRVRTSSYHGENGGGPLGWGPLNNQPHIHLI